MLQQLRYVEQMRRMLPKQMGTNACASPFPHNPISATVWVAPLYHMRAATTSVMLGAAGSFWLLSDVAQPLWFVSFLAERHGAAVVALGLAACCSLILALQLLSLLINPADARNWLQVRHCCWFLFVECC